MRSASPSLREMRLFATPARPATVICGVGMLLLAAVAGARERITLAPAGVVTWSDMVRRDAEVRRLAPRYRAVPRMPLPLLRLPAGSQLPAQLDPPSIARERSLVAPRDLGVVTSFRALEDDGTRIPPDTMGAVGPDHLLTMLNSQVRIQDRRGSTISTVSLDTFWTAGTGLVGAPFDPHVVYDARSGRWIATVDADDHQTTSQIWFAVSETDDPTGGWVFHGLAADPGERTWADFPALGVNDTWIVITNLMFTVADDPVPFAGTRMLVLDKATALDGGEVSMTDFAPGFDAFDFGTFVYQGVVLQPAMTFGPEPTLHVVDNALFTPRDAGLGASDAPLVRLSTITGTGADPSWAPAAGGPFPGSGFFTAVNRYGFNQIPAAQKASAIGVDSRDPRLAAVAFRNGYLWLVHSGALPTGPQPNRTAVFWYQVDPTAMPAPIVQSGVIDGGAGVHHIFPSIAANARNDAFIGFSRSDSSRFVEAVATGRLASDPPGMMMPVTVVKAGEDSYIRDVGAGVRWGDYSATVVDPLDDLAFWTIQQYAAADRGPGPNDDRWGTWWAKVDPPATTTSTSTTTTTTIGAPPPACDPGDPRACDDRAPCTLDRCEPALGCSHQRLLTAELVVGHTPACTTSGVPDAISSRIVRGCALSEQAIHASTRRKARRLAAKAKKAFRRAAKLADKSFIDDECIVALDILIAEAHEAAAGIGRRRPFTGTDNGE